MKRVLEHQLMLTAPIRSGTGLANKQPKDKIYIIIFKIYMQVIGTPPNIQYSDFKWPRNKARESIRWGLSSKSIKENQNRVAGLVLLSLKLLGLEKTTKLIRVIKRA